MSSAQRSCLHCGTPFQTHDEHERFCCKGCQYVYQVIQQHSLENFYQLKDEVIPPLQSTPFRQHDFSWLKEKITAPACEQQLGVHGISCAGCGWLIETLFERQAGAKSIRVDVQRGAVHMSWDASTLDMLSFAEQLARFGYILTPTPRRVREADRSFALRMGLCGAFAMNGMLFSVPFYWGMGADDELAGLFRLMTLAMATLSVLVGGSYFIQRAWSGLRQGALHMDFPIALGVLAAFAGSVVGWVLGYEPLIYFDFVSMFVFLMLIGRWLQERSVERNRSHLAEKEPLPETVFCVTEEGEQNIALEEVHAGQTLRVAPSQILPVRARLLADQAQWSLEWIQGESTPVLMNRGAVVPAGAVQCGTQPVDCQAEESWSDSPLNELLSAKDMKPSRNRFMEHVLKVYLALVVLIALAGGAVWWLVLGEGLRGFQVLISVLVVSCPCGIGITYPMAGDWLLAWLRRRGVFVKEESLWSRLRAVKTLVFDKTGTLTLETPRLLNPSVLSHLEEASQQALWHCVAYNLHPVGRSLKESLLTLNHRLSQQSLSGKLEEQIGHGVCWHDEHGTRWELLRPAEHEQGWDCVFKRNGEALAHFIFEDALRHDAGKELEALRKHGYQVVMLSGDRQEKVDCMAQQLGVSVALGGLTPQQKEQWIETHAPHSAMMIGDGMNDALAFRRAVCRGTPVIGRGFLENQADFYFLGFGVSGIGDLLKASAVRKRAVAGAMTWTVVYNLAVVAWCLSGGVHPLIAAVLMPASSLIGMGMLAWQLRKY